MKEEMGRSQESLKHLDQWVREDFSAQQMILTFDEFLALLVENPRRHLRFSSRYIVDMMDHFGKTEVAPDIYRFHLFDRPIDGIAPKLVGHEEVQNQIYSTLQSFDRQGVNNKLILLHGPNGSAKSTIVHAIMNALEDYSHLEEGAVYTFNWVFPIERHTKGGIGIQGYTESDSKIKSYANLPEEEIAARIPSEIQDHPILLVPVEHRAQLFEELFGKEKGKSLFDSLPPYFKSGDLGPRSKQFFEALLTSNGGNYHKVLKHIQVQRFFYSRRYRKGLVTVEPQMHVDASYNQLTYNKSIGSLPASLQSLNFFDIGGDLIDGNRGIIEYSDLLKRPIDSFKYLLVACETGSVNIGRTIAFLNAVMLGSSNELQLDAFKEFPDFSSFKARIELVRVPYLLKVTQEQEIYNLLIDQVSGEKHRAPHVSWTLALWAVLTRLKKPNSINYPPNVSSLISNLTPFQKAKIYDSGELPVSLSPEDRKLLRSNLQKLRHEYNNIPYYEGRMGASVREIKSILFDAVQNPKFRCLSPLSVIHEMEKFVKRVSEYEFLKQDVKDGFHDAAGFINTVRDEYLNVVDREIRQSMGLYEVNQWEEFIKKYVNHVSHFIKKEKIHSSVTGKQEDPDKTLISEFETIVQAPKEGADLDAFRKNVISQVGAWSLDHPNQPVAYAKVFPEYWSRLEQHYYQSQKGLLKKMHNSLQVFGTEKHDANSEGGRLAKQTVENMKSQLHYCDDCAREVITFFMKMKHQTT